MISKAGLYDVGFKLLEGEKYIQWKFITVNEEEQVRGNKLLSVFLRSVNVAVKHNHIPLG